MSNISFSINTSRYCFALLLIFCCFNSLYAQPANDLCVNAEEIIILGGMGTGSGFTGSGTSIGAPPSCGPVSNGGDKGVWYTFTGTGMTLYEITTCNSFTDFDTEISLFTGSCGSFTCVDGNLDDPSCGNGSGLSTIQVNPTTNTTYYVYVKGADEFECGNLNLDINDLGPVDCVNDIEPPTLMNCPGNISVDNLPGLCWAIAFWTPPTLEDNCLNPSITSNASPGASFLVGTNTVTYSGSDAAGNQVVEDCVFTVTVNDIEVPAFSNCPNDINLFNDQGDCGAIATWTPPVLEDNCPSATANTTHDSGDFFPVGTTTVTYTGNDASGNNATNCSFKVAVTDIEKPMIACPGDISKGTDPGVCGAQVNFTPAIANDNCQVAEVKARYRLVDDNGGALGSWTSRVTDPSDFFPVGRYQVQWRALDIYGNKRTCSHFLDVYDDEDPVAVCKDLTIDFNGQQDINLTVSQVWNEAASSDNCGYVEFVSADLTIGCEELGNTVAIPVTIQDEEGNTDVCTSYVEVVGLPCGWAEGTNDGSLNCDGQTTADYDTDDESFTLTSDGCWHDCRESDKATFVYQELCGDGQLTAQLTDINRYGYAGLMARESLDPDARRAGLLKNYSTRRVRREYRAEYGGIVAQRLSNRSRVEWLRIVRTGNKIKSYTSTNGSSWRLLYQVTFSNLEDCIYLGMMTYSLNSSAKVEATFENVTLSGTGSVASDVFDDGNNGSLDPGGIPAWSKVGNVGDATIEVFPNPASDRVQLILEDFQDKPAQLIVRDAFGKMVRRIDLDSAMGVVMSLEVQDLTPGIYIISLVQDKQLMNSKKLVVQP